MPNWIKINKKGLTICALCAYSVVQMGYNYICTNLKCEKHYDLPAEYNNNPFPLNNYNYSVSTSTGTVLSSSTSTSTSSSTTTTTLS